MLFLFVVCSSPHRDIYSWKTNRTVVDPFRLIQYFKFVKTLLKQQPVRIYKWLWTHFPHPTIYPMKTWSHVALRGPLQ